MLTKERPYKESHPINTVNTIRNILIKNGIFTRETSWKNPVNNVYSTRIEIANTNSGTNGKGKEISYTLASAYGEMMERIQNNMIFRQHLYDGDPFYFYPDENDCNLDQLLDTDDNFLKILQPDLDSSISKDELKDYIKSVSKDFSYDKLKSVPFYCFNKDKTINLPYSLLLNINESNGAAAGNTISEALFQGMCEIFERYSFMKICYDNLTPPTISNEYFRKYPEYYKMIKDAEKATGMELIVKDFSLDQNLPCLCVVFVDRSKRKYSISVASEYKIERALERCITESLQGRTIELFKKEMFSIDEAKEFTEKYGFSKTSIEVRENVKKFFINGNGHVNYSLFGEEDSYKSKIEKTFIEIESFDKAVIEQCNKVKNLGYNIFIRDNSFLGFPSVFIFIPGMSNIYEKISYGDIIKNTELLNFLYNKKIPEDISLKKLLNIIEDEITDKFTFIEDLYPVVINKSQSKTTFYSLLSAAWYKLGNCKKAKFYIDKHINEMEMRGKEVSDIYNALSISFLLTDNDEKYIEKKLNEYFSSNTANFVIKLISNKDMLLNSMITNKCKDCTKCTIKDICSQNNSKTIIMNLKQAMSENPIDQQNSFNFLNREAK